MSSIIAPKPIDRRKPFTIKIDPDLHEALSNAQAALDSAGFIVHTDEDMSSALRRHLKKILTSAFKEKMLPEEKLSELESSCATIGISRGK